MTHDRAALAHVFFSEAHAAMNDGSDADDVLIALFSAATLFGMEIGGRERMAGFLGDMLADLRGTARAH